MPTVKGGTKKRLPYSGCQTQAKNLFHKGLEAGTPSAFHVTLSPPDAATHMHTLIQSCAFSCSPISSVESWKCNLLGLVQSEDVGILVQKPGKQHFSSSGALSPPVRMFLFAI